MTCSTPGFPVLQCLPEFAQTHVHWVSDAIQTSHLLSSPFPLVLNLSQQWVGSSHQEAWVLELQLQQQTFCYHWGKKCMFSTVQTHGLVLDPRVCHTWWGISMHHRSDEVLRQDDEPHGEKVVQVFNPSHPVYRHLREEWCSIFKRKKTSFCWAGVLLVFAIILPNTFLYET